MRKVGLVILLLIISIIATSASTYAELRNNQSADVVIGQPDFTSNAINQTGSTTVAASNSLQKAVGVWSNGEKLFIGGKK